MAVSLKLVHEKTYSDTKCAVEVKVQAVSTSGSYNNTAQSGWVSLNGDKKTFSHGFSSNTTTTLATKSWTVSRAAQSTDTYVTVKASYASGVSSGTVTASKEINIAHLSAYTVTFNKNTGSSTTTKTVYYGKTTTFPTSAGTKTGYTLSKWNTNANGTGTSYAKGATTPAITSSRSYYAIWTPNKYTVTFNPNGGASGSSTTLTKTYDSAMTITSAVTPARQYYNFLGWASTQARANSGIVDYTSSFGTNITSATTVYAVWELSFVPPTLNTLVAKRYNSTTQMPDEDGTDLEVLLGWTNGEDPGGDTALVTGILIGYRDPEDVDPEWQYFPLIEDFDTPESYVFHSSSVVFARNKTYDIQVTLIDDNTSVVYTTFLSKSSYIWKVVPKAIPTEPDRFVFGVPVEIPNIVDLVYPVGAIYMSINNTNPGTLFGGTWTAIEGRFLVGAGSYTENGTTTNYTSGNTGGSAVIPYHRHSVSAQSININYDANCSGTCAKDLYYSAGSGTKTLTLPAHNTNYVGTSGVNTVANTGNIPPYMAVYMWQRTA